MSARFTPAATTSTSSSPGPGWGSATCSTASTSGPPGSVTTTARTGSGAQGAAHVLHVEAPRVHDQLVLGLDHLGGAGQHRPAAAHDAHHHGALGERHLSQPPPGEL